MQSTTGPSASLPEHLGRYTVLARLGAGGMAEVLLGYLEGAAGFGRYVAIKRLLPHFAEDSEIATMFVDEGRVLARIRHPNVVAVEDLVDDGQHVFLVLEHLVGESLAGFLSEIAKQGLELSPDLAAYVVAEAAAGLHAAHTTVDDDGNPLHLVHRDVSPQNLFVTVQGDVKVLDFGIARHEDRLAVTRTRGLRGKLAYMSPEQLAARPFDHRADIFALGTVLFEALTARRLFRRDSDVDTIRAVCTDPIPDPRVFAPSLPAVFAEICMRALARDPERRFRTALEMREALLAASLVDSNAPRDELAKLSKRAFGDALEERARRHRETKRRIESTAPPASTDRDVALPPPGRLPRISGAPGALDSSEGVLPAEDSDRVDTVDERSATPFASMHASGRPSEPEARTSTLAGPSREPAASGSSRVAKVGLVLLAVAAAVFAAVSFEGESAPPVEVLREAEVVAVTAPVVSAPAVSRTNASNEPGEGAGDSTNVPTGDTANEAAGEAANHPSGEAANEAADDATNDPSAEAASEPGEALIEDSITIELDSRPPGARVALDGVAVGVTPMPLTLPRSTARRVLTFSRDAHHDHVVRVVPDRPSRVHAVLRRRAPRAEDEPSIAGAGIDLDYP